MHVAFLNRMPYAHRLHAAHVLRYAQCHNRCCCGLTCCVCPVPPSALLSAWAAWQQQPSWEAAWVLLGFWRAQVRALLAQQLL